MTLEELKRWNPGRDDLELVEYEGISIVKYRGGAPPRMCPPDDERATTSGPPKTGA